MKNYLKILLITLAIQLGGLAVSSMLYDLSGGDIILSDVGDIIVVLCIIASIIVDIILAIRWGTSIGQKLVYIFLMPTNYLWLAWLIWVYWYFFQWFEMLREFAL